MAAATTKQRILKKYKSEFRQEGCEDGEKEKRTSLHIHAYIWDLKANIAYGDSPNFYVNC